MVCEFVLVSFLNATDICIGGCIGGVNYTRRSGDVG